MPESKDNNKKDGLRAYTPLLVAIVVTFGGTVGANYFLVRDITPEIVAPDRFTGSEARALKEEIKALRDELSSLKLQVSRLPPRELLDRLISIEVKVDRIEREVEKHHP